MADKVWKKVERALAKRLNGRRQGAVGRRGPDVLSGWLSVEVKHRKRLPEWLKTALDQAKSGASEQQLAIAVLHEAGQRHADDLVLMRLGDFELWFGSVRPEGEVSDA